MSETNQIITLLERILECVEKKKPSVENVSMDLHITRKSALMGIFWKLAKMPRNLKDDQKFPKEIWPESTHADAFNPAVVPVSILRNRCGHLKCFRARNGDGSLADIFEEVLSDCGEVVVYPIHAARKNGANLKSSTVCVWSLDEARRYGLVGLENDPQLADIAKRQEALAWSGPNGERLDKAPKVTPRPPMFSKEDLEREDAKRGVSKLVFKDEIVETEEEISIFKKP